MERRRRNEIRDRRWRATILFLLIILAVLLYTAVSCVGPAAEVSPETDVAEPDNPPAAEADSEKADEAPETPTMPQRATFAFVGDVLIHQSLINAGEREGGRYDFSPLFRHTEEIIRAADFAAFDMEGTLTGPPYSGYPAFSTPEDILDNLRDAGFDLAITANNHQMDFDYPGLVQTAGVFREKNFPNLGTRKDDSDPKFLIKDVNGMKIGLTAFTYESERLGEFRAMNNVAIPKEYEHLVDSVYVNPARPELMEEDGKKVTARIEEMRKAGAEAILVFFHWGTEYGRNEDGGQLYYSQVLADQKVDVVVACGPHVIQPIRSIRSEDGEHEMLCYYSVGNHVSNQQYDTGGSEGMAQDGLIALMSFERNSEGEVKLSDCGYISTYVYKQYPKGDEVEYTDAVVIPLRAALADPAAYRLDDAAVLELEESLARVQSVMEQNTPGNLSLTEFTTFFVP